MKRILFPVLAALICIGCNKEKATSNTTEEVKDTTSTEVAGKPEEEATQEEIATPIEGMEESEFAEAGVKAWIHEGKVSWQVTNMAKLQQYLNTEEFIRVTEDPMEVEMAEPAIGVMVARCEGNGPQRGMGLYVISQSHQLYALNLAYASQGLEGEMAPIHGETDVQRLVAEKEGNKYVVKAISGKGAEETSNTIEFNPNSVDCSFEIEGTECSLFAATNWIFELKIGEIHHCGYYEKSGRNSLTLHIQRGYTINSEIYEEVDAKVEPADIKMDYVWDDEAGSVVFNKDYNILKANKKVTAVFYALWG